MGSVYIKHEGIEPLGGPVPEENLEFWEAKGWTRASDEEVEAHMAEQGDTVQPPAPDQPEISEDMKKDELLELADARGIEIPSGATKADIVSALNEGEQ